MKQDKWTQQLRDKLADYEPAAPEGLWDDIEAAFAKQIPAEQALARKVDARRARFITMRRWAVAASLAALLLGGGYWRWSHESSQESKEPVAIAAEIPDGADGPDIPKMPEIPENLDNPKNPETQEIPADQAHPTEPSSEASVASGPAQEDALQPTEQPNEDQPSDQPAEQPAEQPSDQPRAIPASDPPQTEWAAPSVRRGHRALAFSLYASNGFGTQNNSNRVMMSENMAANYSHTAGLFGNHNATRSRTPIYLADIDEKEKHYQPVSFGLTVNYPLTDRLFVMTGIVYTKLRSDFTNLVYGQVTNNQQTLHYVGMPLAVGYQLWDRRRLKVYVTSGIQVDWNVQADLETIVGTQSLDKDACQWSVGGGLGVQYNLLPQIGLYAEPGVKHYVNNGSRLDNFFKDKPTNFSIQVGLRINLGH